MPHPRALKMKKCYEVVGSKTCTERSEDDDDEDSTMDHSRKLSSVPQYAANL